jgi:hypothetical protein
VFLLGEENQRRRFERERGQGGRVGVVGDEPRLLRSVPTQPGKIQRSNGAISGDFELRTINS